MHGSYPLYLQLVQSLPVPVCLIDASELVQQMPDMISRRSLMIAVSQSGESGEIVELTKLPGIRPAAVVSVTNQPVNSLANWADIRLASIAGPELTVSSKSYTGGFACLYLLGAALRGATAQACKELVQAAVACDRMLKDWKPGMNSVRQFLDAENLSSMSGVGENLQDHIVAPLRYACNKPVSIKNQLGLLGRARIGVEWLLFKHGLGASNFFEAGAFFDSGSGTPFINMQHEFLGFLADFQDGKVVLGDGFQYFVSQMRPYSRGRIRLKSRDPKAHPAIHFNYLDDQRDVKEMVDGIKRTREMVAQKPWDEFRSTSLDPDLEDASDTDITRWLRNSANTEHHPAGTCRSPG